MPVLLLIILTRRPLTSNCSARYVDLGHLQKEGIPADSAAMMASVQDRPQDPQNVEPPQTEQ